MTTTSTARRRRLVGPSIEDEIDALVQDRKLRVSVSGARALVDRAIEDAHRWAEYYDRKLKSTPRVSSDRKRFGHTAHNESVRLRKFMREYRRAFCEPSAPPEHALSWSALTKTFEDLAAVADRLDQISNACSEPSPGIQGRPSDGWLLGFIWGMAIGWRELTTAKISPRGHFPRFLQAALSRLHPDVSHDWEPLIKTAVKRFSMNKVKWLRPGDDLARFPLNTGSGKSL
jgi:hypothetical protein